MRKTILLLTALMGALLMLYAGGALAQQQSPQEKIRDRYIVVLNDNVREPAAVADQHARERGLKLGFVYSHAINGYSALIQQNQVGAVQSDPRVAYVEPDQPAYAEAAQVLPWGINEIDADLSSTRAGDGTGAVSNVNAYIIDSGIYQHADLNVVKHVNFAGDGKNTDCYGHGTHVAGTVAAKDNASDVVGSVPGAPLTGVKVLGCEGTGLASGVIKGVDWVTANSQKPAITNMSVGLGGNASQALDDAVRNSAASGIFYSLAAGNKGTGTCSGSPARTGAGTNNGIATVAATDELDQETSWSNYGSCVDIWAPGARILSTKMGGGTTTMGGTSMAAPHVGGGAALYLTSHTGESSSAVEAALKGAAESPGTTSKDGRAILREYVGGF
jgi:subtilisin family serine protease